MRSILNTTACALVMVGSLCILFYSDDTFGVVLLVIALAILAALQVKEK